jgi:hypothetical protein
MPARFSTFTTCSDPTISIQQLPNRVFEHYGVCFLFPLPDGLFTPHAACNDLALTPICSHTHCCRRVKMGSALDITFSKAGSNRVFRQLGILGVPSLPRTNSLGAFDILAEQRSGFVTAKVTTPLMRHSRSKSRLDARFSPLPVEHLHRFSFHA